MEIKIMNCKKCGMVEFWNMDEFGGFCCRACDENGAQDGDSWGDL